VSINDRKQVYNKVNFTIVSALRQIVGEDDVLWDDAEALEPYSHDEVVGLRADPEVVVRVRSAEQVAEIMRLAQRERVPVTPRGAGYGLSGGAVPVLVGSEGTLAVVTKIVLRLLPLPKVQVDLLVPFDDFQAAADTVSDIIAHRVLPTTIEFMEQDSVLAVERLLKREMPYRDAAAHLLIQLDGNGQQAVDTDYEVVGELCLAHGARDVLVAKDSRTRDRLWEARRLIIDALNHESPINHMEDVVVPRAEIPPLLRGIKEIAGRHNVRIVCFGHAGDGNVHVNVLRDGISEERWQEIVPLTTEEMYRLTLSLGGMITGEHGIGVTRRRYLPMALDDTQIDIMRQIKAVFDPHYILNPGKVFP
jgi:glycolate oxidase